MRNGLNRIGLRFHSVASHSAPHQGIRAVDEPQGRQGSPQLRHRTGGHTAPHFVPPRCPCKGDRQRAKMRCENTRSRSPGPRLVLSGLVRTSHLKNQLSSNQASGQLHYLAQRAEKLRLRPGWQRQAGGECAQQLLFGRKAAGCHGACHYKVLTY